MPMEATEPEPERRFAMSKQKFVVETTFNHTKGGK
jgi:hypothetical protein